jgi:cell division protein FtsQ
MGRKQDQKDGLGESKLRRLRPFVLPVLATVFVSLTGAIAFLRAENFLVRDSRFVMRGGVLAGEDSPDLRISGISRAAAAKIRGVFAKDQGQSIYQTPLEQRREELLGIRWVRDASVRRVWPNRVEVRVVERKPEAFIRLPGAYKVSPSSVMLVDLDGVILPVPEDRVRLELPVLNGIREDQPVEERAARVRMMKRITADLGAMAAKITEYDLRDTVNGRLVYDLGDRMVTLIVGHEDYALRVRRFLEHYPEIQKRAPSALTLDLRLPDRITAVEEEADGQ